MTNLVSHLIELSNAPSAEALWTMHCDKMGNYGFDRILYGHSRFITENSLGDPQDFLLLSNHDPDYLEIFIGSGLYRNAPMVRWALNNVGACSWRYLWDEMARGALTEDEKKVVAINQKHKVTTGYSISFKSVSSRAKGAIALTARCGMTQDEADAIWHEHGQDIIAMNNVAHLKILTLPYSNTDRVLTLRQREVLEWVGDGKTTQDIAMIMGLTPATVEKHLRLARQTLGVETTAQAVLKAAFQNQMYILNSI